MRKFPCLANNYSRSPQVNVASANIVFAKDILQSITAAYTKCEESLLENCRQKKLREKNFKCNVITNEIDEFKRKKLRGDDLINAEVKNDTKLLVGSGNLKKWTGEKANEIWEPKKWFKA